MTGVLDPVELVSGRRIIICCGSGGVGKTTTAAALGVLAARQGRKVLVMTIDPARRLAQAMGLEALGHEPQTVALQAPGRLAAMMLDTKRTFDRLVETHAPDQRIRDAIFANNYYQQLSSSLGGSRELIAMEQVLEAANTGDHELLIVDTPPSQHALDFLDAPRRLLGLIDGTLTGMLVRPYSFAAKAQFNLFKQSSAAALKFLERLTGVEMLADLSDFLLAFSSMFDGFKERSHRVTALMAEPTTAFLLVCAPDPASVAQVDQFVTRLQQESLTVAGILANRVHPAAPDVGVLKQSAAVLAGLHDARLGGWTLVDRIRSACDEARQLADGDREMLSALTGRGLPLRQVPHFNRDLHSMEDLSAFAAALAGA